MNPSIRPLVETHVGSAALDARVGQEGVGEDNNAQRQGNGSENDEDEAEGGRSKRRRTEEPVEVEARVDDSQIPEPGRDDNQDEELRVPNIVCDPG